MRFIILLIICSLTFTPLAAYGSDAITIDIRKGKISTIKKGQAAPFSGHLLDARALLILQQNGKNSKEQCKLNIEYIKKSLSVDHKLALALCNNARKSAIRTNTQIIAIKDKEIERLRKIIQRPPGLNLVPLWITLGILAGAGVTVALVFALKPVIATAK